MESLKCINNKIRTEINKKKNTKKQQLEIIFSEVHDALHELIHVARDPLRLIPL